jgi:outer membrane protein OmpA-like peptidoglycan-associated protein
MTIGRIVSGVVLALALTGCAAVDTGRRAGGGTAPEADTARAPVVGAIAESAVGDYMNRQGTELARVLTAERARGVLQIASLPGDVLMLVIAGDLGFDFNSAQIRPEALATYDAITAVLQSYGSTVVHIVCHTDASGSDPYNQDLSQRRAAAIAAYLGGRGLAGVRVRAQGRGEREPVANNDSVEGRKRNRRIDIVIKPVIEGQEQQAWVPPSTLAASAALQPVSAVN